MSSNPSDREIEMPWSVQMIRQAMDRFRAMSKLERLEILVKSGGLTEEQAERARKTLRETEAGGPEGAKASSAEVHPGSPPGLAESIEVGTLVKIRRSGYGRARVVEDRGKLGPNGTRIYRVQVRRRPFPTFIEVREDQLERVDASAPRAREVS